MLAQNYCKSHCALKRFSIKDEKVNNKEKEKEGNFPSFSWKK
jgi:hypothetical protein